MLDNQLICSSGVSPMLIVGSGKKYGTCGNPSGMDARISEYSFSDGARQKLATRSASENRPVADPEGPGDGSSRGSPCEILISIVSKARMLSNLNFGGLS